MAPTWILHGGVLSQLLPPLAAIRARERLGPARRGAVAWSALLLTSNLGSLILARLGYNNHWLGYLIDPLLASVGLWTFSLWQTHSLPRIALRLLIPLYLLAILILTLTVEDLSRFSNITGPFTALLLLGASLYTVIVRTLGAEGSLLGADWFWISGGLALSYGSDAAFEPLARLLLGSEPGLILSAYEMKSLINIVVSLALVRGILCPSPPLNSGGLSSPGFSPSSSSSSRSGSPS
ncbi:MAG: hypothetical protein OEW80_10800 [Gemmatimonadota bacterium]|nr:hypothetical protein [Gemmatimonadota bacterium]